jgi:glycerophosphoryl diester phosphodiesterase
MHHIVGSFDLQGHRGCRGLRPENTIAGFQHALALGVSTLELDIALSADGVPIVSHDPQLNPAITRGPDHAWLAAPGPLIHAVPAAALAAYDVGRIRAGTPYAAEFADQVAVDGARIPALAEVCALAAGARVKVRLNIELKTFPDRPLLTASPEAMAEAVVAVLAAHALLDRTTIQSFDWRSLDFLAARHPTLARAYLTSTGTLRPLWLAGRDPGSRPAWQVVAEAAGGRTTWSPQFRTLTAELVAAARGAGLVVLPWTVNAPADMARLIAWGVDGIISDRPDLLRQVLAAKGMPLPPAAS